MTKPYVKRDLIAYLMREVSNLMHDTTRFRRIPKTKKGLWYIEILYIILSVLEKLYEQDKSSDIIIELDFEELSNNFKTALNENNDKAEKEK